MKDVINLGMSYDGPSGSIAIKDSDEPKKHYPSFHYSGDQELGLPKSGEMTVRFKEVESSHSDRDGKKTYSCTVEIREILDVEAESDERPAKSHDESSAVLDKLMEARMRSKGKY